MRPVSILRTAIGAALLVSFAAASQAQGWPSKPVRFVVPFPAGGSTDVVGRIVAEHLRQGLGQTFVIDNRAGAGGTTGSDAVAKASPDGYTMLIGTSSTHAIASGLYGNRLPYDQVRDFAPVTLLGSATILLSFAFLPYVQKNSLHALAVTNAKPSPVAPNLPTVAETLPGFEALQWFGILMPAGTPADIVAKLNAEIVRILRLPEVRERLQSMGIEIAGNSPGEFAAFMRAETAKWGKIVKESGAKID